MARKNPGVGREKILQNESFIALLFSRDSLVRIRQLLDEKSKKLEKLQKAHRRKVLNFGSVVVFDDLPEMLAQIKKETDEFLGLKDISSPRLMPYYFFSWSTSYLAVLVTLAGLFVMAAGLMLWHYYRASWFMFFMGAAALFLGYRILSRAAVYGLKIASDYSYSPLTQTIIVPAKSVFYGRCAELTYILAHEYAHHIENIFGFSGVICGQWDVFKEGFAIGIQRHIAHMYALREGNDAFLYWALDEEVGAMQGVYAWLSKKLGTPVTKHLKWLKTSRRAFEPVRGLKSFSKTPSLHAFGCVLFLLLEEEYGEKVYGDILRGEFEFKKQE